MIAKHNILDEVYDALNRHDASALADLSAPDVLVEDVPWERAVSGRDAVVSHYHSFFKAFPDARYTPTNRIEQGDVVVDEWLLEATNAGELNIGKINVQPTNQRIALRGVSVFTLRGDEVAGHRLYYDTRAIASQLGLSEMLGLQRAAGE